MKTHYKNKRFRVVSDNYPSLGLKNRFFWIQNTESDGEAIAILPYRFNNNILEYLLVKEFRPPWGRELTLQSLTGGVESNLDQINNATKELKEESGYDVSTSELIDLGVGRGSKLSDSVVYMYGVNLTGKVPGKRELEGYEKFLESVWLKEEDLYEVQDPIFFMLYFRLKHWKFDKNNLTK